MAEKIAKLREETTERLREMLAEVKGRRLKYRVSIATGEAVKPADARGMRVEVARIKTILRAIELVAERAGVDQAAARSALGSSRWDIGRAAAAAKAAAKHLTAEDAEDAEDAENSTEHGNGGKA